MKLFQTFSYFCPRKDRKRPAESGLATPSLSSLRRDLHVAEKWNVGRGAAGASGWRFGSTSIPGQLTKLILPLLHHQLGTNLLQTHQWEWIVHDAFESHHIPRAKIVKRCQHLEPINQNALQRALLNTHPATTLKETAMLKNCDA